MTNNHMNRFRSIIYAALLLMPFGLSAQQPSATLYYMTGIPNRAFLNPAFQPDCKGFLGMPGLSQIEVDIGNSGFSFNDVMIKQDTTYTIDLEKAIGSMPAVSQLGANVGVHPIAFGFRFLRKGYFTFEMAQRSSVQLFYPKDMFGLAWKGNAHEDYLGKRISFDHMGLEVTLTNEISAGYSHQIFKGFTLGVRGRAIQGIANLHTERFLMGLTTDADDFAITADLDMKINANLPFVNLDSLMNGVVPDIYVDLDEVLNEGFGYLNNNTGYSFDLGASYFLSNRLFLSASVNDIGYISWQGSPHNFTSKGTFTFTGLDLQPFINGDSISSEQLIKEFTDSLIEIFNIEHTTKGYTQRLIPTLNLGAGLYISKDDVIGFHLRNQFYNGLYFPKMTISYNHRFGRMLSLSGSWGLERGNFTNIGVGLSLKTGPFQYYLISDNAMAFAKPFSAKRINVQTGMNWVFGRNRQHESRTSL
jgi:hypothetical protein